MSSRGLWNRFLQLFSVEDSVQEELFSLGDREPYEPSGQDGAKKEKATDSPGQKGAKKAQGRNEKTGKGRAKPQGQLSPVKLPVPLIAKRPVPQQRPVLGKDPPQEPSSPPQSDAITPSLDASLGKIKEIFRLPQNKDVVVREFYVALQPPVRALAVFLDGVADKTVITTSILEPLMVFARQDSIPENKDLSNLIKENLLPGHSITEHQDFDKAVKAVLAGATLLLFEGYGGALSVETKGWQHRSIERPRTEMTVLGSNEGFTENLRTNTSLIRKRLRTEKLVTEIINAGRLSNSECAIMYVDGVVNPKLVREVIRRIQAIDADVVDEAGILEQFIEDHPYSLLPQILTTERPDRVINFLTGGHVAVLLSSSPYALIMPVTFWTLIQTGEDAYVRWPFGSLIRLVRLFGMFMAAALPGITIALINFHPEAIPTDLLLAVASTREQLPFPLIVEVLILEVSFELIREAGLRIPSVIGPTIGIVGALILGQAAVAANIISPILVIMVSITALGSSSIPYYMMGLAIRAYRFIFIFLAGFLGLFGLSIGFFILVVHVANLRSFGVPFLSPAAPYRPPSHDIVLRSHIWKHNLRPSFVRPLDQQRQARYNRPWDPHNTEAVPRGEEENHAPGRTRR